MAAEEQLKAIRLRPQPDRETREASLGFRVRVCCLGFRQRNSNKLQQQHCTILNRQNPQGWLICNNLQWITVLRHQILSRLLVVSLGFGDASRALLANGFVTNGTTQ